MISCCYCVCLKDGMQDVNTLMKGDRKLKIVHHSVSVRRRTTHNRILFDQLCAARHAETACGLRGAIQSFRPNSHNNQQYIQD